MPFNLGELARQTRLAADYSLSSRGDLAQRIASAVEAYETLEADEVAERVLARKNRPWLAGVPLNPIADRIPAPPIPASYITVSTDGSHIDQDHHAAMPCWLINVGRAAIGYGAAPFAQLETRTHLGYRSNDLHIIHGENRIRVQGQLLNVKRQVAEIAALADLCEEHRNVVALVDGSLILTSISRSIQEEPSFLLEEYLALLDRIHDSGAIIASYISRPASTEIVSALRLGWCPDETCDRVCRFAERSDRQCATSIDIPDRLMLAEAGIASGERTGAWRSLWKTSHEHYGSHAVHFFYIDMRAEIARVEIPEWVANDPVALDRLHAVLLAQGRVGDDGYPRVLIEAHHCAVVNASDRRMFQSLLDQALQGRGYSALSSAKERAKRGRYV